MLCIQKDAFNWSKVRWEWWLKCNKKRKIFKVCHFIDTIGSLKIENRQKSFDFDYTIIVHALICLYGYFVDLLYIHIYMIYKRSDYCSVTLHLHNVKLAGVSSCLRFDVISGKRTWLSSYSFLWYDFYLFLSYALKCNKCNGFNWWHIFNLL